MERDIPRVFVFLAFAVVVGGAVVLGMVLQSALRPASTPVSTTGGFADVTMMVQANLLLGPDNQTHDAFVPSNFIIYTGQVVNLTFVNFDDMPHSFTSTMLNVNFQIPGSQTAGVPALSHFQFEEANAGVYRWWCADPCDTDAGGWAMTTGTDGQPGQIGYMGGFVTVLSK